MTPVLGDPREGRRGVGYSLAAFLLWGFLPLYFALLHGVPSTEIVAQRVLWSVPLLLALVALRGHLAALRAALANPRVLGLLFVTALLIGANWLIYIWAIGAHHVLETSLGYFLNPLVNVVLGVVLLKERLTLAQTVAVGLAAVGVSILAFSAAAGLWISLSLALTFGIYGLLRKVAPVESLEGLTIETMLLFPVALFYVLWLAGHDMLAFGDDRQVSVAIAFAGVVTATPLLLFAAGARRLRYTTIGLLQYIAPSIQFLLAILVFGEALTTSYLLCFGAIWAGLALYAIDGLRKSRT